MHRPAAGRAADFQSLKLISALFRIQENRGPPVLPKHISATALSNHVNNRRNMNRFRLHRLFTSSILLFLMTGYASAAADVDVKETALGTTHQLIIKSLTPSPDGKRLAYVVSHTKKAIQLVVDGKVDPTDYAGVAEKGILFSPDSKRVAFLAQAGNKWVVVVDGTAGEPYSTYAKGSLAFSPTAPAGSFPPMPGQAIASG